MIEKEKLYLTSLLNEVNDYKKYTEGFYVFGNIDKNDSMRDLAFYGDLDSWLNNINYLNQQIKNTAKMVIDILEEKKDVEFDIRGTSHRDAYYYTENMMFRISILWDLLAQIFNKAFDLNEEVDEIHHYIFFQKYQAKSRRRFPYHELAKEIYDYFEEEDSIQEGP